MSRNHYFAGILHSIYNLLTAHIPLMLVTAIIIVYSSVNNTATPEKHPQLPATHVSDTRQHNVDNSPHHRLQPAEKSVCIDVRPRVKLFCNISSLDVFVQESVVFADGRTCVSDDRFQQRQVKHPGHGVHHHVQQHGLEKKEKYAPSIDSFPSMQITKNVYSL